VAGGDQPATSRLNELWSGLLEDGAIGEDYEPPSRVVSYRGGDVPDSPCATGTNPTDWQNNARYCEADGTILFDESWLRDFEQRYGAFAPAAILAHEWGHHIQALIGTSTISNQFELQADCFAGMYVSATEAKEGAIYEVGGQIDAALTTFFNIGTTDYRASEWFAAGEHGSRSQRTMAMGTGYLPVFHGLPWCLGYSDFQPQDVSTVGPYRLLNLPGRTEERAGDVLAIHAERRSGQQSSDILLAWIERLPLPGQGATPEQLSELRRVGYRSLKLLNDPIDVTPSVRDGTGTAYYMENTITNADGSTVVQHGFVALVSPEDGVGGLLILVVRDGRAPTQASDLPLVEEALMAVYQVINRLCGPDQSSDPADPDMNVACLSDQ
jgi:hypothetical protein